MHYNTKSDSFKNIVRAFENEAHGHVRYMILEEHARKSGNEDLARLYGELAQEEYGHARLWYNEAYPADENGDLEESIKDEADAAMRGYPDMASKAELEGYEALSDRFLANGSAEASHRDRLAGYRDGIKDGSRYQSHEEALWRCSICGHMHTDYMPPTECPLCGYNRTAYRRVID